MSRGAVGTETTFFPEEISLRDWARRRLGTLGHELRVARVAEMLFNLTRRWHELGKRESRLLACAALVHDVGRAEASDGHAKTGARMIFENTTLPLTQTERRRLAFLVRYHRGSVPQAGDERYLDPDCDNIRIMRTLLALLRAADALDSRTFGGPQLVATVRGKVITVYGYVAGNPAVTAATLGRPKKFRLLESVMNCQVRTEWFGTDRLALVS
jgi:exopolyphosphatase/pppGpp-phosphohydrolase